MAERVAADFGAKMKRAREERGVSLRQIANATKISVSALEALERNDISRLPGGIFTRAFVRSYAAEIGLDPEQTVRDFLTQFPHDSVTVGSPHVPQEDHAAIESGRRSAETALRLFAISLPVAGAILYLTLSRRSGAPAADTASQASPAVAAAAEPGGVRDPSAAPAVSESTAQPSTVEPPVQDNEPLPVAAEPLTFEIVAKTPVSLGIAVDGVQREPREAIAGERIVLRAAREITLKVSDAAAVQLTINGQPAVSLGGTGEERTVQIGRRNFGSFLASQ